MGPSIIPASRVGLRPKTAQPSGWPPGRRKNSSHRKNESLWNYQFRGRGRLGQVEVMLRANVVDQLIEPNGLDHNGFLQSGQRERHEAWASLMVAGEVKRSKPRCGG